MRSDAWLIVWMAIGLATKFLCYFFLSIMAYIDGPTRFTHPCRIRQDKDEMTLRRRPIAILSLMFDLRGLG